MYTYRCNGIVNEFRNLASAMGGVVRHRVNPETALCQEDHELCHSDRDLTASEELTFIGLGFNPQYIGGLTRPDRPNAEFVPDEFYAINRKFLNEQRRSLL